MGLVHLEARFKLAINCFLITLICLDLPGKLDDNLI